jgi:hypothetical protein
VAEKTAAPVTEVQLGFAFLSDAEPSSATPAPAAASRARAPRAGGKPRGLAETIAAARMALLEAPLDDVSTQLLSLLEFCEAALTRALDVVPTRPGVPLSAEEYRSLRGIGQAQWFLAEEQGKRETKPATSGGRKAKKKMMNEE